MNHEDLAKDLIYALDALSTKENIEGVMSVLKSIEESINLRWEGYLIRDINETMFMEHTCCVICGNPIQIERTRDSVKIKQEQ